MADADKNHLDLDTRVLSEFIYALNIARRQVLAYPSGHPVIGKATRKLMDILPLLLEFRPEMTIGIARDTLLVDGLVLDANNPVYRDLAHNLFDAKVASLTINNRMTEEEICRFFELFKQLPDQFTDECGLARTLSTTNIQGIKVQGVDFSAFHATEAEVVHAPKSKLVESDSAALWKSFVTSLVDGTIDPDGVKMNIADELDPEMLAGLLNEERLEADMKAERSYEEAITMFLKQADNEQIRTHACQETLGRLGDMVGRLKPEMRRRFLNSTLRACADSQEAAVMVLNKVPQHAILEAMEHIDPAALQIPQSLMDVLGKLATHRGEDVSHSRVAGESNRTAEETTAQLSRLFSPDKAQFFMPRDYQDALSVLAAAEAECTLDKQEVEELIESLDGHAVERQFTKVLLEILDLEPEQQLCVAIGRNLEELIEYFLETGDYMSLVSMHDHLKRHVLTTQANETEPDRKAFEIFAEEDFVVRVLDGLELWGKPAHPAIKALIKRVGVPFVDTLLDRLAEEADMSRRRLYIESLRQVGTEAQHAIIARLHDRRWYFVRNLVILLRDMNDRTVLGPLGRLVGYAHPKVQYEVMRTFLYFEDPRADRYILKELQNKDPRILLHAIKLAARSRDPRIVAELGDLLNAKFPIEHEEILKASIVQSLGDLAMVEALPGLSRFLIGKSLLRINRMTKVKVKALTVLEKIDSPQSGQLAEQVYRNSSGELARVAGKICVQLNGKLP